MAAGRITYRNKYTLSPQKQPEILNMILFRTDDHLINHIFFCDHVWPYHITFV